MKLANLYLRNAKIEGDPDIAMVLCHETEASLFQAKMVAKNADDQVMMNRIGTALFELSQLLEEHHRDPEAEVIPELHSSVVVPPHIFAENVHPPAVKFTLPKAGERLNNTQQLAGCLSLLQALHSSDDILEPKERKWAEAIEKDEDEQDRLNTMATEVIRVFERHEPKDAKAISEVVCLVPVLSKEIFRDLLREFHSVIGRSGLLNVCHLEGLAQLLQGVKPGDLDTDELVKILDLLSTRLQGTQDRTSHHIYQLTLTVSSILDAMADADIADKDLGVLHELLSNYIGELKKSLDPYLIYQAAYAYQALLCVQGNKTVWQTAMRRTGAVKGVDLDRLIEGLQEIQKGLTGESRAAETVQSAHENCISLARNEHDFLDCLMEGFSFERKRDWYSALRGIDVMIRDGELATFRELVCEVPCRLDPAFQWGVCQRLGEVAANPMWNSDIRRDAIAFLREVYREDVVWGQQSSIKQWILKILMQLSSASGSGQQRK
ncbi:hypothetical protein BGX34_002959 [Mortierella sp. NVP85]|nr:hypothetical protein BGX34_002959 [Mortierella sp. NVP85]